MKGLLVRIGIDQAYGGWNAPVDVDGRFVYVPIPEKLGTPFHPGLERRFGEVLPALHDFCAEHNCQLSADLSFPNALLHHSMHLDPDFECLTYGDEGARRGAGMVNMGDGDLLVFYGGLRPIHACEHRHQSLNSRNEFTTSPNDVGLYFWKLSSSTKTKSKRTSS